MILNWGETVGYGCWWMGCESDEGSGGDLVVLCRVGFVGGVGLGVVARAVMFVVGLLVGWMYLGEMGCCRVCGPRVWEFLWGVGLGL